MLRIHLILLLIVWAFPFGALAEPVQLDGVQLTPSGEAYLKATRLRGIERQVGYFDPARPPPPLQTDHTPEVPETQEETKEIEQRSPEEIRWGVMLISGAILAGVLYLMMRFSGGISVSFSSAPQDAKSHRGTSKAPGGVFHPKGLQAILAMGNREEALVALCHGLLGRIVGAQGVLLHKSWTARDTLRRVPRTHPDRGVLQNLVLRTELVQFGHRHIDESEFQGIVSDITPIWTRSDA
jgi:hypothetical protein